MYLHAALLALLAMPQAPAGTATAAAAPGAPGPVDRISASRNLCRGERAGQPFRLRGVVTLAQGTLLSHRTVFYMEDESGGVSVDSDQDLGLRRGEEVEVRGVGACIDGLEPEVQKAAITRTGAHRQLVPHPVEIAQTRRSGLIGRLVRVRGEVLRTSVGLERDRVVIGDGSATLVCYIRRRLDQGPVLPQLAQIGSRVEVQGVLVPSRNGDSVLRLREYADVVPLTGPPQPWLKPLLIGLFALGAGALAVAAWILTLRRAIRTQTLKIRHLLQETREASRLKSEILANVSHEIRTPIHGILGLQSMVLESDLGAGQRAHLTAALEATRSLQSLLDDVLDLSRIEAGRMSLNEELLDPAELLRSVCRGFSGQAIQKGLGLDCNSLVPRERRVLGDLHRMRQVLSNLAGNAIKFTEQGNVSLTLSEELLPNHRTRLVFSVCDTGIGISEAELPVIFDTFRQADGSITRRFGGSGLGLAIAQKLTTLMGGELKVASRLGEGSTFSFQVACQLAEPAAEGAQAGSGEIAITKPLRLLLVEDNKVNQLVAARLLSKDGHLVSVANSGQEAIDLFQLQPFDLVLMDIQMPGMDGIETTRIIRSLARENAKRVPIIAVSAHAMKHDAERYLAAGMNDFLGKPFEIDDLRRTILRAAAHAGHEPAQSGTGLATVH